MLICLARFAAWWDASARAYHELCIGMARGQSSRVACEYLANTGSARCCMRVRARVLTGAVMVNKPCVRSSVQARSVSFVLVVRCRGCSCLFSSGLVLCGPLVLNTKSGGILICPQASNTGHQSTRFAHGLTFDACGRIDLAELLGLGHAGEPPGAD